MKETMKVDPKGQTMLSRDEMMNIKGGSLTETVVKYVVSLSEYFFHMGVREGKRMKAML